MGRDKSSRQNKKLFLILGHRFELSALSINFFMSFAQISTGLLAGPNISICFFSGVTLIIGSHCERVKACSIIINHILLLCNSSHLDSWSIKVIIWCYKKMSPSWILRPYSENSEFLLYGPALQYPFAIVQLSVMTLDCLCLDGGGSPTDGSSSSSGCTLV